MIYLDNAATTQILPEVFDAMLPYLKEEYGNPGSLHSMGQKALEAVEKAREQVADIIGATSEQIIFTSSGTEANNLALKGVIPYLKEKGKNIIITNQTEHDSVLNAVEDMCIKHAFHKLFFPISPLLYSHEVLSHMITRNDENVGIVSTMHVNNITGDIYPVNKLCEVAHKHGALFHTDCVQALDSVDIDVNKMGCDFLSLSGHKIHAPKGVGALFVKDRSLLSPLVLGGSEQEFGLRGGTENVASIVGFGKACEILKKDRLENEKKTLEFKKLFLNCLQAQMIKYGLTNIVRLNSTNLSKILNMVFVGVDAQSLVLYLSSKGVCVSAGSACSSKELKPNKTLLALGLTEDMANSSIRISFSHLLTERDVLNAACHVANGVKFLLGCS